MSFTRKALVAASVAVVAGCETQLEGLLPTPETAGPKVVFDLLARPLPEIPFPNDMATRFDLDAATGRRVNASVSAPTALEEDVRAEFNHLDGWGTFAPITVSFQSEIDPLPIRAAHLDDDFSNDAVYLVNLTDGSLTPVDMGRGNFPATVQDGAAYFNNDFRALGSNLLFESYEEVDANNNGTLDLEEDTDHDGIWDHPNTADPTKPLAAAEAPFDRAPAGQEGNDVYRDLLTFYERQTHTLIIRPVVPLTQRTTYAVVLTNRIKDANGAPMSSPFPFVAHQAQTDQLKPLLAHVEAGRIPGLTTAEIAFTWAFTTQSVSADIEAIRDGLYGTGGTMKYLSTDFPAELEKVQSIVDRELLEHPVHPLLSTEVAQANGGNRYIAPIDVVRNAVRELGSKIDLGDLSTIVTSFDNVDYLVFGSFRSPDFLDDPDKFTAESVFSVNPHTGEARIFKRPDDWKAVEQEYLEAQYDNADANELAKKKRKFKQAIRDRITFFVAIPKTTQKFKPPFPYVIYGHGASSAREEALPYAGYMAKFGFATVGMNSYAHGFDINSGDLQLVASVLSNYGLKPFAHTLFNTGRARDLNNDGVEDSGGDFWVADTFHTRDVVRQSCIDWMQLIRNFKAFGTYKMGDVNGDGTPELAGDFNADGVVDVGGPGAEAFLSGGSLGGILTATAAAIEPNITAAAPIAGGAGLGDIAIRTELGGVIDNVFSQVFGPILYTRPVDAGHVHLVFKQNNVGGMADFQITGEPIALAPGDTIEITNLQNDNAETQHDKAYVPANLRIRLQVGADAARFRDDAPVDYVNGTEVTPGACESDEVKAAMQDEFLLKKGSPWADCLVIEVRGPDGAVKQKLDTFTTDVRFRGRLFKAGTRLVALEKGFGFKRQGKTFRRFMSIAQTVLEPADPVNYARHYFLDPLPQRKDRPLAILMIPTGGDMGVPVNTGLAMARVGGLLDHRFDPARDADWGMSPNDVVIRAGMMEANEKLRYMKPLADYMRASAEDPATQPSDAVAVADRLVHCKTFDDGGTQRNVCDSPALTDITDLACAEDGTDCLDDENGYMRGFHGVPRLKKPLRETVTRRYASKTWEGTPTQVTSALVIPYPDAGGRHGFDLPNPNAPFDIGTYMVNLMGYYFYSRGTEVRYDRCMRYDGYTAKPGAEGRQWDPACDFLPWKPVGD